MSHPGPVGSLFLRTNTDLSFGIASQVSQGPHLDHLPPPQDPPALAVPQVPPCVDPPPAPARRPEDRSLPVEHRERHEED